MSTLKSILEILKNEGLNDDSNKKYNNTSHDLISNERHASQTGTSKLSFNNSDSKTGQTFYTFGYTNHGSCNQESSVYNSLNHIKPSERMVVGSSRDISMREVQKSSSNQKKQNEAHKNTLQQKKQSQIGPSQFNKSSKKKRSKAANTEKKEKRSKKDKHLLKQRQIRESMSGIELGYYKAFLKRKSQLPVSFVQDCNTMVRHFGRRQNSHQVIYRSSFSFS